MEERNLLIIDEVQKKIVNYKVKVPKDFFDKYDYDDLYKLLEQKGLHIRFSIYGVLCDNKMEMSDYPEVLEFNPKNNCL